MKLLLYTLALCIFSLVLGLIKFLENPEDSLALLLAGLVSISLMTVTGAVETYKLLTKRREFNYNKLKNKH